jgi:large subunit ribosomal protein L18
MALSRAAGRREMRARRHRRVRKKISGNAERPRLVVFRSLRHMEGQLVDDDRGATLVGVSTREKDLDTSEVEGMSAKVATSFAAGRRLAEKALDAGIDKVIFDRGGYKYHGRVQAFAEGARHGGLKF